VEGVAQQLDGEVELGPEAVDLVAVAIDVRAWQRQVVRVDAPMHRSQAPVGDPAVDALGIDAGVEQLPAAHASLPAVGDGGGSGENDPA
jgi:hypothetical protein